MKGLERDERLSVTRRVEAMESELKHLIENKKNEISLAKRFGWSPEKLQILFCLNSFYQRIIVPLWSSAINPTQIGSEIPIHYGKTIIFDKKRNAKVDRMGLQFLKICSAAQIPRKFLEAQRTSDLIYIINQQPNITDADFDTE